MLIQLNVDLNQVLEKNEQYNFGNIPFELKPKTSTIITKLTAFTLKFND